MLTMRWPGSDEERRANRATHQFTGGHDSRCWMCDCRPGHLAADWPCGVEPPRSLSDGLAVSLLAVPYEPLECVVEEEER